MMLNWSTAPKNALLQYLYQNNVSLDKYLFNPNELTQLILGKSMSRGQLIKEPIQILHSVSASLLPYRICLFLLGRTRIYFESWNYNNIPHHLLGFITLNNLHSYSISNLSLYLHHDFSSCISPLFVCQRRRCFCNVMGLSWNSSISIVCSSLPFRFRKIIVQ